VNWEYQEKEFTQDQVADYLNFVYTIINLLTNKKYIGKKKFLFQKSKQVKGKKKKFLGVSDWFNYWGSCKELLDDVEKYGKDNFKKEILRLCRTKGEASYFEAKAQFDNDVLLYPSKFYNKIINCRIHSKHLPKDLIR